MSTEDAVAHGIRATAGVVTSAALVMVGAFAIFATLGMIDFKMMGVGLAVAVLIDATIVRAVLLPATMKLLGDWNWYLPRWLEWLPRIAVTGMSRFRSRPRRRRSPRRSGASRSRTDGNPTPRPRRALSARPGEAAAIPRRRAWNSSNNVGLHSRRRGEPVPARPRSTAAAWGVARMAGERVRWMPSCDQVVSLNPGRKEAVMATATRTRGGGGSTTPRLHGERLELLLAGIAPLLLGLAGLIVLEGPADRPSSTSHPR